MKRFVLFLSIFFLTCTALQGQYLSWQKAGNLPILANPDDGHAGVGFGGKDTLYASVSSRNILYISTDNGLSWKDSKKNVAPSRTPSVLTSKSGVKIYEVYEILGSGKEYFTVGRDSIYSSHIFHSADSGKSWNDVSIFPKYLIPYSLFYKDSMSIFAFAEFQNALFRSSDKGLTWDSVYSWQYNRFLFAYDYSIIYVSDDSGNVYTSRTGKKDTWERRTTKPIVNRYGNTVFQGFGTIWKNICIASPGYISLDTGATWQRLNWDTTQKYYARGAGFDSSGIMYATGGDYIFRSSDTNRTWTTSSLPIPDSGSNASFPIVATANGSIWVLTNITLRNFSTQTLYHSADDGLQWKNFSSNIFTSVSAIGAGADGSFLAGVFDTARHYVVARTYDGGTSWSLSAPRLTNEELIFVGETAPGKINAIDIHGYYHHSEDNGASWSISQVSSYHATIYSFCIADSLKVLVGSVGRISISTDVGISWRTAALPTDLIIPTSIAPSYGGAVLAVFDSVSVMRSIDDGKSWTPRNTGFPPNIRITALVGDSREGVYAATNKGVFFQFAGDSIWHGSTSGLADINIRALTIRNNNTLFATTSHSEIFRAEHITGGVKQRNFSNTKIKVSPNPATSSTTISYFLPKHESIKLELIDQLGRVLRILHEGNEDAGSKTLTLSVKDLSAGIYYLRMQTSDGITSEKIFVEK